MKLNHLLLAALLALGSTAATSGNGHDSGTMTVGGKTTPIREDIEVAFDRHKGRLYAAYAKALKVNPRAAGKIVFDIDIATAGNVTDCRVVTSELPRDLEAELCARIRQFQFGTQQAPATVRKSVDFFPA